MIRNKYDDDGVMVFYCDHEQTEHAKDKNHQSYASIYAGEKTRFEICRLCSTMALGLIVGIRIREAIDGADYK